MRQRPPERAPEPSDDERGRSVGDRLEQGLERLEDRIEEKLDAVKDLIKPKLRGWLHAGTFPLAVALGAVLVLISPDTKTRVASAIFAVSAALLFGVSAIYHRGDWGPRGIAVLKRFDHANIFLIIAGTYTPFSVLLLPEGPARTLLWIVWTGAVLGVAFRVLWVGAPRWLYVPVYIALGWVAVVYLPQFRDVGGGVVALVLIGGVFYTAGAVIYGLKRPRLSERWFGFHELFHAFTILAFLAHWSAVALAMRSVSA